MFDQKDPLFRFGIGASLAWLTVAILFIAVCAKWDERLAPNAWGDLFAGIAAPLAFLWLVLGFLQQGKELRISSEALRLQVEELRASVEQQRELVEVTREQMLATIDDQKQRRLAEERAQRAEFVFKPMSIIGSMEGVTVELEVTNVGAVATNIEYELMPPDIITSSSVIHHLETNGVGRIRFRYQPDLPPEGALLSLSYLDSMRREVREAFRVDRNTKGALRVLKVDNSIG